MIGRREGCGRYKQEADIQCEVGSKPTYFRTGQEVKEDAEPLQGIISWQFGLEGAIGEGRLGQSCRCSTITSVAFSFFLILVFEYK